MNASKAVKPAIFICGADCEEKRALAILTMNPSGKT